MKPQRKSLPKDYFHILCALLLLGGVYLLLTALSPLWLRHTPLITPGDDGTLGRDSKIAAQAAHLYIPELSVSIPFAVGDAGVLERGAWWRAPRSGNPKDGGNFVVAAHRFQIGWTPMQTARKSPLYRIDTLAVGDTIIIDYQHERYTYKIATIYRVAPTAVDIEAPTNDNRLTLYTCTLGGSSDGREVIIAKQL